MQPGVAWRSWTCLAARCSLHAFLLRSAPSECWVLILCLEIKVPKVKALFIFVKCHYVAFSHYYQRVHKRPLDRMGRLAVLCGIGGR
jgi:hypothetical protein